MGLRIVPTWMKVEVFFNCWTRKEAYIKAQGQGLSLTLDSFDVSFAPGEPATLLATREDPREASRWILQELAPGQGYVGHWQLEDVTVDINIGSRMIYEGLRRPRRHDDTAQLR